MLSGQSSGDFVLDSSKSGPNLREHSTQKCPESRRTDGKSDLSTGKNDSGACVEVNLTGSHSYQRICEINRSMNQPIELHIHTRSGETNPCSLTVQEVPIEVGTEMQKDNHSVEARKASSTQHAQHSTTKSVPGSTQLSVNLVQPKSQQSMCTSNTVLQTGDGTELSGVELLNKTMTEVQYAEFDVTPITASSVFPDSTHSLSCDFRDDGSVNSEAFSDVESSVKLIASNENECEYAVNIATLDANLTEEQVQSLSKSSNTSLGLGETSGAEQPLVARAELTSVTENPVNVKHRMSSYINKMNQQTNEIADLGCELVLQQKLVAEKDDLIRNLTQEIDNIHARHNKIRDNYLEYMEMDKEKLNALHEQLEELNAQNEELRRRDHKFKHSTHWDSEPKKVHFEDTKLPHEGELEIKLCSGRTYVIPGYIQTNKVDMILDTAAQVSCISRDFFQSLQGPISKEAQATLKGIGDTPVEAFRVSIPVQFGSQQQLRPFYVVDHESPVLLGLDFIMENCGILDTQKEVVTFNGEEIPMILIVNNQEKFKISRVAVVDRQYLPPNSHTQVKVKFNRPLNEQETFLIEHNKSRTPYLVANTLVKGGKTAYVSVINDSENGVTLPKNFHVGTAKEVQCVELAEEYECEDEDHNTDWSEAAVRQYIADLEALETPMDAYGKPIIGRSTNAPSEMSANTAKSESQLESTGLQPGSSTEDLSTSGLDENFNQHSQSNTSPRLGLCDNDAGEGNDTASLPSEEEWERRLKVVSQHMPTYMTKLFTDSCMKLSLEESTKFGILLLKYQDRFSAHDFDLGCLKGVTHKIDTGEHQPLKQPLRRSILSQLEKEKECIDKLIKAGIIVPSKSEWASPPLLVKKADGGTRFCIDYRELNKRTIKDSYPLPLIEDCLDVLADNVYFSRCDMSWGYHQILMDPDSASKTAFNSRFGLFQFHRMSFGLTNAPATFQRAMNLILKGLTWSCVLAYLDDVMVLGKSFEDHLVNLEKLFKRFRLFQAKLKPSKCLFFQTETEFLGRVISQDGVRVSPDKVKAIQDWPLPENKKQLQSFLGFVNYHREHIENFAELTASLYDLAGPKSEFQWTDKHTDAVNQLKDLVTHAPCLAYPLSEGQFILDCDASGTSIGAVLSQVQPDGSVRPISFASNVLLKEQRNYCITRRELLSVVKFTRHFRHYLLGRDVLVRTDHSSLAWLMNFSMIEGQLARWLEQLSRFRITFSHRKGKKHVNADSMSRIPDTIPECVNATGTIRPEELPCYPCRYCQRAYDQWHDFKREVDDIVPIDKGTFRVAAVSHGSDPLDDEDLGLGQLFADASQTRTDSPSTSGDNLGETRAANDSTAKTSDSSITGNARECRVTPPNWVESYTSEDLRKFQLNDPKLRPVMGWLESKRTPSSQELYIESPFTKKLWENRNMLVLRNGVLYYEWIDVVHNRFLFVVPSSCKDEVMRFCHDLKSSGHMGIDKSIQKTKQSFYWPGMGKDIRLYVQSCNLCNRYKKFTTSPKAKQRLYHAGAPMERVHLDILGPFQRTERDNLYVLVIIDQFSKWPECVALSDSTAEEVALAFLVNVVAYFGCPLKVHTDQGSNFDGNVFRAFCHLLEIAKTRTTPYHPESNAQCETKNRIILQMIRIFCDGRPRDWDNQLPFLCMALRATRSRSTGFTPNMLMLGREVHSPYDVVYGIELDEPKDLSKSDWVRKLQSQLESAHAFAREHLKRALCIQKHYFDLKSRDRTFAVGDFVRKKSETTKRGSNALKEVWSGPFFVVKARHPVFTIVRGKKTQVVHLNRLRLCRDRVIPFRLRLQRQQVLNLDESIAYDSEERDEEDLAPVPQPTAVPRVASQRPRRTARPQTPPATTTAASDDVASDTVTVGQPPQRTGRPKVSSHTASTEDDLLPVAKPTTTRGGRTTKVPSKFAQYVREGYIMETL